VIGDGMAGLRAPLETGTRCEAVARRKAGTRCEAVAGRTAGPAT
jgi:hypothetical protein